MCKYWSIIIIHCYHGIDRICNIYGARRLVSTTASGYSNKVHRYQDWLWKLSSQVNVNNRSISNHSSVSISVISSWWNFDLIWNNKHSNFQHQNLDQLDLDPWRGQWKQMQFAVEHAVIYPVYVSHIVWDTRRPTGLIIRRAPCGGRQCHGRVILSTTTEPNCETLERPSTEIQPFGPNTQVIVLTAMICYTGKRGQWKVSISLSLMPSGTLRLCFAVELLADRF
jgi:hypothetical protein